jgi:hypothetical protein
VGDIFCYFLGAGASRNALPIVSEIPDKLKAFVDRLEEWSVKTGAHSKPLSDAAKWLVEETESHATIDTFAKKLFIRNAHADLKKLKAVTSCFFVYEQSQKPVDYRYDTFLASVLEFNLGRPVELPKNIRILSWNYDTQLEKAFYNFCDDEDLVMKAVTFNHNVERLNGYCGTHPPGHLGPAYRAAIAGSKYDGLNSALHLYDEYMKEFNSVPADINFAWETDPEILLRNLQRVTKDATIVVLIGYSFPFFNRQIDRLILKSLTSVRKIYVQLPEENHQDVKERLSALRDNLPEVVYLKGLSSFYIPFDYP